MAKAYNRLEDRMSWDELGLHVLGKVGDAVKPRDHKKFLKWFADRESVGYRFDYNLVARAFKVWQDVNNDLSHLVCFTGREGIGKTTTAANFISWVDPSFCREHFCDTVKKYIDLLLGKYKNSKSGGGLELTSLLLDEGTEAMSADAHAPVNKALIKTLFIQRKLKILTGVCQPNFFALSPMIREHHTHTLIHVRLKQDACCYYRCFVGHAINIIADVGAKKAKNVMAVKVPNGTFWDGYCHLRFPKNISFEGYSSDALGRISDTLSGLRSELSSKKGKKMEMSSK